MLGTTVLQLLCLLPISPVPPRINVSVASCAKCAANVWCLVRGEGWRGGVVESGSTADLDPSFPRDEKSRLLLGSTGEGPSYTLEKSAVDLPGSYSGPRHAPTQPSGYATAHTESLEVSVRQRLRSHGVGLALKYTLKSKPSAIKPSTRKRIHAPDIASLCRRWAEIISVLGLTRFEPKGDHVGRWLDDSHQARSLHWGSRDTAANIAADATLTDLMI